LLSKIARFFGALLAFLGALIGAGVGGCNIHELGHLITGRIAGVPIEGVIWCTPGNGRVVFAYQEPAWVGYAGGLLAAAVLVAVYMTVIRPRLDGRNWRAAGVAVLGTALSQLIVALLEGSDPQRYASLQDNTIGLVAVAVLPLVVAGFAQSRYVRRQEPPEVSGHR
jgi:hypothetical protein